MTLAGVVPMLPTPFDAAGQIVWDDFAPIISYQLENGVRAIAALGLGGEASRLSVAERLKVAETVLSLVPSGIPVLIGVSADDTKTACTLAGHAAAKGAAVVMVAPPNVKATSRTALRGHYLAVCDAAAAIEVMIQDAPAFLDVSLGAAFVAELADARANVRYAKSEASPAAERTAELTHLLGERVGVFGGASGLHFIDVLEAGAIGIIPGCEAPAQFVGIFDAFAAGRREEAAQRFARLQPLLVFETQTLDLFIASSKAILKARGLIRSDLLRRPSPLGHWSRQVLARHVQTALQHRWVTSMTTEPIEPRVLPRRRLGRKGLTPTVLGLGGAPLGELFERLPEQQADDVVQEALAAGITFFDTAPWYGHGLSEHRIGRGLRQIDRERVIVSTKVGRIYRRPADLAAFSSGIWAGGLRFEPRFDYSGEGVLRSYEDSLLRLGLNRVDCLVIHDLDNSYHPGAELHRHRAELETSGWAALEALRRCGEIGAIGAGIMDCSMMGYFLERFDLDFFLVAMPYTLLDQTPLRDGFVECQKRGINIVIGSPYASGILATGPVPGALYYYAPATPPVLEKTRRIAAVCDEFGVPLQAAALQFPLAHPAVTAVIPGATSREIVARNVANLSVAIPDTFWAKLKAQGLLLPDAPLPEGR